MGPSLASMHHTPRKVPQEGNPKPRKVPVQERLRWRPRILAAAGNFLAHGCVPAFVVRAGRGQNDRQCHSFLIPDTFSAARNSACPWPCLSLAVSARNLTPQAILPQRLLEAASSYPCTSSRTFFLVLPEQHHRFVPVSSRSRDALSDAPASPPLSLCQLL